MTSRKIRSFAVFSAAVSCLLAGLLPAVSHAQSSSSSSKGQQSSSSSQALPPREKAPSLVDPAGPTISLVSSEPVFVMAAALNACGYDEGLEESAPVRKKGSRRDQPGAGQKRGRAQQARQRLPVHCTAPHDGLAARHLAVHLIGAVSDASAGDGDVGGVAGDAARLDAGGGDCALPAQLRGGPWTCTESGWQCTTRTTTRPTSFTTR